MSGAPGADRGVCHETFSDQFGRFKFGMGFDGRCVLRASPPAGAGVTWVERQLDSPSAARLEVVLPDGVDIVGVVYDRNWRPLIGGWVFVEEATPHAPTRRTVATQVTPGGAFHAGALPSGPIIVRFYREIPMPGQEPEARRLVDGSARSRVKIRLRLLRRTARVRGGRANARRRRRSN